MLIFMRTTLTIDDKVFVKAKQLAAEQGRPMGELVTQALRDAMNPRQADVPRQRFVMPTYGSSQGAGIPLSEIAELRDEGR